MTISFARGMRFYGQSTDMRNKPAARAEFYKDVHAETDESTLECADVMRTYFDRTIKLVSAKRDPNAPADEGQDKDKAEEPKPEVAMIECVKDVSVVNSKYDPVSKALSQRQRIDGDYLIYEKLTGKFRVPGEGQVYLYEREGEAQGLARRPQARRGGPCRPPG